VSGISLYFSLPLLSSYTFSIPFSNVLILIFSSLPIQSSSVFYKVGLFKQSIEQLGQTISSGLLFMVLQIKEFFYSYLSISDSIVGSIFYFTTGLHGMHVMIGLMMYYIYFNLSMTVMSINGISTMCRYESGGIIRLCLRLKRY
jgi:heme/copper-type cytochrome/quinol oxidase subunit 3